MRKQSIIKSTKIKSTKKDKLEEIFKYQELFGSKFCIFKTYNTKLKSQTLSKIVLEEKERWTKEFIVCCFDELSEILNWTNWKHWKSKKYPIDETQIKYEIIDLLHFVISLALLYGMTADEMYKKYMIKNKENFNRQKRGY